MIVRDSPIADNQNLMAKFKTWINSALHCKIFAFNSTIVSLWFKFRKTALEGWIDQPSGTVIGLNLLLSFWRQWGNLSSLRLCPRDFLKWGSFYFLSRAVAAEVLERNLIFCIRVLFPFIVKNYAAKDLTLSFLLFNVVKYGCVR